MTHPHHDHAHDHGEHAHSHAPHAVHNNPGVRHDDTILLIGHGSREAEGNDEIHRFVAQWRQRQPRWNIEVCFIEFAAPSLHDGLQQAGRNARRVLVLPLILNAAGHVKMEIPEAIEHARDHCPGTEFLYGPHLTACDPILDVLRRNLRKCMSELDMPDPTTTGVVLLGRGSSDRQANGDVAKMARWLMEETDHELVDLAFTGITWPRLERAVQRQVLVGMRQVVVLPYYLFTGTLMQRIARQVDHLRQQYPQVRFAQASYFGFEKEIFALLEQRVADLRAGVPDSKLPCDGCKYRELAHDMGHGHSHEHTHAPASAAQAIVHLHSHAAPVAAHAEHAHDHQHGHAHDHTHDHDPAHAHGYAHAHGHAHALQHAPQAHPA